MEYEHLAVGTFPSRHDAETAVRELQQCGLSVRSLSIAGRDEHTDEHVFDQGDERERRGTACRGDDCCCNLWHMFGQEGFFWGPDLGPLRVAGLLAGLTFGAIEDLDGPGRAADIGRLGAVGAGLVGLNIPRESVRRYEAALRGGDFILIFMGSHSETEMTRQIFDGARAVGTALHVRERAESSDWWGGPA